MPWLCCVLFRPQIPERLLCMSLDEFKLLSILVLVFFSCIRFFRRNIVLTLYALVFFCTMGFIAQLLLGREMNRYTPNITIYIFYVSAAVIVTWGTGLTFLWALHAWLTERLHISPGVGIYSICGLPGLILLEIIGSNIIKMKLHNYSQYDALLPYLNTMHAPKWLYAYYIVFAITFFYISKALGLYASHWNGRELKDSPALAIDSNEKAN
jgi:hypothetical protein